MRVLVCGGRQFAARDFIFMTLDDLRRERGVVALMEGCARGADSIAGEWADARGVEHLTFPADWKALKRKAGPIRNQQMLDEGRPDLVVAFPGGKGTAHMSRIADEAGVETLAVDYPPDGKPLPLKEMPVDATALDAAIDEMEGLERIQFTPVHILQR